LNFSKIAEKEKTPILVFILMGFVIKQIFRGLLQRAGFILERISDCGDDSCCFCPGFFFFEGGVGVRDDTASDLELPPTHCGGDCADGDIPIHGGVWGYVSEGTAVGSTDSRFEFSDYFHGANFWGTGDASPWKDGSDDIAEASICFEGAADGANEVQKKRECFYFAKSVNA